MRFGSDACGGWRGQDPREGKEEGEEDGIFKSLAEARGNKEERIMRVETRQYFSPFIKSEQGLI